MEAIFLAVAGPVAREYRLAIGNGDDTRFARERVAANALTAAPGQSLGGVNRVPDMGLFSRIPLRSEATKMLDQLRKVGNYVRNVWSSSNPDSYSHYRRGRERQRKQAERSHEEADRSAELERVEVQRGRDYEERYSAERAAEEAQTESPGDEVPRLE